MTIWLDNHLSPEVGRWIETHLAVKCIAVRDLGYARAPDAAIFDAARAAGANLMTKDGDFAELVDRLGPPPHIIWLTCGNTSTPAQINRRRRGARGDRLTHP